MTPQELRELPKAPDSVCLSALWLDARGDWEASHLVVQEEDSPNAARIHAYLHRKEGDNTNADYWYAKAGVKSFVESLEQEWLHLASLVLEEPS